MLTPQKLTVDQFTLCQKSGVYLHNVVIFYCKEALLKWEIINIMIYDEKRLREREEFEFHIITFNHL